MASRAKSTPPNQPQPWVVKPASARAKKQWESAKKIEPNLMLEERARLTQRPLDRSGNPKRTHQLKGELSYKTIGDRKLEQWQHDLTGSGRIWYCPDKKDRVIWVVRVSLSHPRETG